MPTQADKLDVKYVAHLARLHLSEEEAREFQAQLDQVIGYFNDLSRLDVSGVEPTAHAAAVQNVFRKDEPRPGLAREKVMANAPEQADGQFIVPRILE